MHRLSHRSFTLFLGVVLLSLSAQAQSLCTANAVTPVVIRAEGVTEQLADISFTCSGNGTPGVMSIQAFVSPSLPITSKLLNSSTGATEATAILGSEAVSGVVSGSMLNFPNVTVPGGNFTVTLTNIRVDATYIPSTPGAVSVVLFVSGTVGSINAGALQYSLVGVVSPSLQTGASGSTAFPVCGTLTTSSEPAFAVTVAEKVQTVFKTQGGAANTTLGSEFAANTETGYYLGNNQATSGTRFRILFSNVPTGAAIYVPVSLTGAPATFQATLTASENGAFSALAATANRLAPVTLSGGAGEAVYEITADDPTVFGGFSVPITVTGTSAQLASAAITATASLAPVGSSNIPRFSAATGTVTVNASASACTSGVIAPATLSSATPGIPYFQWLTAGSAKTWSIASGSLPSGLSLSSPGLISGVPATGGSYSFTVQEIDQSNNSYTKAYTLQVVAPLSISTASLPAGSFGTAYSQTLTAAGGQGGYAWIADPGLLPPGLTLNSATGLISGTPTTGGTYPFSVTVTDSSGSAVAQNLSIAISVPPAYCNQLNANTSIVRAEALNDLLGTLNLSCSGSGGTVNLQITLSAQSLSLPITSKVLNANTGLTEAIAQIAGNSYSGYLESTARILNFTGVVIPAGSSTVTIGNIRSDTSSLTVGSGVPPAVNAVVVVTGIPSVLPAAEAGFAQNALAATSVSSVSNYASCAAVSASGGPAFTLKFGENFVGAFKTRGDSTNTILASYTYSETGYYVSIGGVNNQANSATRIAVVFTGVPAGVTVYVPTALNALGGQGAMVLIPTESGAFAPIVAIAPNSANTLPPSPALAPVVISNGTGVAVFEATAHDSYSLDNYSVPVYLVSGTTASAGTIKALVRLAPVGAGAANIPDFISDGTLLTASQFTLCLSSSVLPQGQVGTPYPPATLMPSGGTAPYTFASAVLPAGLTMSGSGTITGTPTAATASGATLNGSVIVQDSAGNQATFTFTVQVLPGVLSVTTSSLPSVVVNNAYSATLAATLGTTPYTWSISSGVLPTGLTLNPSTGSITGTPTFAGTSPLTVKAIDSASPPQTATRALSIYVATKLQSIVSPPWIGPAAGSPVVFPAVVIGGTVPYTCTLATGALPPGVTLNATTCLLSGIPASPGIYNATIAVADSGSPPQSATVTIVWNIGNAIEITNRTLPALLNGVYTFTAAGGYPPYSNWTLASGALPAGWTLNSAAGTISAPTSGSAGSFGLTVQDSDGETSAVQIFSASPVATSATLALSAAPSVFGQAMTFSATVTPSAATGNVTFFDGTAILGTAPLSGGQAALTTQLPAQGPHAFHAAYWGSQSYASATSPNVARTLTSNPQSGFMPPVSYPTTSGPGEIVMGDFNGDGKADFAVTTSTGVDVLIGRGDGTFQSPVHTVTQGGFMAAGDFNGDGKLDIAFTNLTQTLAYVLMGNGDGTFQTAVGYQIGGLGNSLAVADFNGDGIPDIASLPLSGGISVLLGNGDGTFYQGASVAGPGPSEGIVIADFNGDGVPDMATTSVTPVGLTVFLSNGDGTFKPGVRYTATLGPIAAGDFNGDGFVDLATFAGVLLGVGNGTFQAQQNYPGAITGSPLVGDFNGDGKSDIALTGAGGLSLLFGNGDGTFGSPVSYAAGLGINSQLSGAVGDFNGDGRADIVIGSSSLEVLLGLPPLTISCVPAGSLFTTVAASVPCTASGGTGPYTFSVASGTLPPGLTLSGAAISGTPTTAGSYTFTVQVTDSSNPTQTALQSVTLTVNAGLTVTSSFPPVGTTVGVPISPIPLVSGGTPPYTCTQTGFSTLPPGITLNPATCVLSGTPTTPGSYGLSLAVSDSGSPSEQTSVANGWVVANAVQITNRNLPPLVSGVYTFNAAGGQSPYTWTIASGALPSGWTLNSSAGTISAPTPNTTATFALTAQDSAGRVSAPRTFVTAARSAATVSLSLSAAPSTYGQPVALTAMVTPTAATGPVSFFDGTAFLGTGILSAGQATLTTRLLAQGPRSLRAVYEGTSAYLPATSATVARSIAAVPQSGFTPPVNYTTAYVSSTVPGDFNGDGKTDLAISTSGGIDVLPGNGDGTFGAAINSPGGNESYLIAADFNGDGKLDIASASGAASAVYVQMGNGDGTFQPALGYPGNGLGLALAVADFNGDGIPDIAFDSQAGVTVLLGNGDGSFYQSGSQTATVLSGAPTTGFVVGDFNRDGFADVAITVYPSTIVVFLGNGDGTLQPGVNYTGSSEALATGDFTGDGNLDLATRGGVLLGNGDGTFKSEQPYPSGLSGAPTIADFNGDGKQDVLIATSNTQGTPTGLTLLLGNGDGAFSAQANYSGAYASAAVADFNGDGRPDIAASTSSGVSILLGLPPLNITCTPATGPVYTGTAWSTSCPATGGTSPYTWTISAGTLPAGFSLNASTGAISGAPTGSGAYTFTIQVSDSSQPIQTATQTFTGILSAPPTTGGGGGGGGFLPPPVSTLSAAPASFTFNAFPGNPPRPRPSPSPAQSREPPSPRMQSPTAAAPGSRFLPPPARPTPREPSPSRSIRPTRPGNLHRNRQRLFQPGRTGLRYGHPQRGGAHLRLAAQPELPLQRRRSRPLRPGCVCLQHSFRSAPVRSRLAGSRRALADRRRPGPSSAPASIPVSVNPASLAAGTYTANIVISSSVASTVNVPVTLTVVSATRS